jgi:hypothetical protein
LVECCYVTFLIEGKFMSLHQTLSKSALVGLLLIAGCATSPDKISATYVSPLQYQSFTCPQIEGELQRVGVRVGEVTGQQKRAANSDNLAMGVGLIVFWPALFFLASDNNKKEELARLKGEYDALQQAGNTKDCARAAPTAPTR